MTDRQKHNGKIFIISGPSGVGKDTTVGEMKNIRGYKSLNLGEPKSYTTRRRRKTDIDGCTPYIFVSEKRFSELLFEDIIESTESHGHLYGTSKKSFDEVLASGHNIIKILDKEGAVSIKGMYPKDAVLIYLTPPSMEELAARLRGRGTEDYAEYNRRMIDNMNELRDLQAFDYIITADGVERTAFIIYSIMKSYVG